MKTIITTISLSIFLMSCGSSKIIETKKENVTSATQEVKDYINETGKSIEDAIAEQQSNSVIGVWDITTEIPRGNKSIALTIFNNNGLKGKTKDGTFDITQKGDTLYWTSSVDTPMGNMELKNEAIVSGNSMEGSVKMSSGPMAGRSMKLTGVKK